MKRIIFICILLSTIALFPAATRGAHETEQLPLRVVTTIFPLYDTARQIAGDFADVSLLLPPGIEAHSFEPTPMDILGINRADLFIYAGEAMEPWAERVIGSLSDDVAILDASQFVSLLELEDHDHHGHGHHDHDHGHDIDPHFWTDPIQLTAVLHAITEQFIKLDSTHAQEYEARAEAYEHELLDLHDDISREVETLRVRTILYGGHFAFGYFAHRYGFDHISPYRGFSPSAEPTAQRIIELIKTMDELELDVIYHEELIDPRVARTISEETGARMMLLHGIHNVTKDELEQGVTYISIMRENIARLKDGLGVQ